MWKKLKHEIPEGNPTDRFLCYITDTVAGSPSGKIGKRIQIHILRHIIDCATNRIQKKTHMVSHWRELPPFPKD